MLKHGIKIPILEQNDYKFSSNFDNINLDDICIRYYNGIIWKLIPITIMKSYPIIYDKYYETNDNEQTIIDITIGLCPFSSIPFVYENIYHPTEYMLNNTLVLKHDEKMIYIKDGNTIKNNEIHTHRHVVYIDTLINIIKEYQDCHILTTHKTLKKLPIKLITSTKYHPETLVHIIEYISSKTLKNKYTLIIGKDVSKKRASGYDSKKSGLSLYLEKMNEVLQEKNGFIIPIYYSTAIIVYKKIKTIYL